MTTWEEKEVLVLVKAYPTPSIKYGETVCTAGITRDGKWIRLYPVQFRDLPKEKQYSKFTWIRVKVTPSAEKLGRPESHKIDQDSVEILGRIEAGKHWTERESYFLPHVSKSLDELMELRDTKNVTLGAFKPKEVTDFRWEKGGSGWTDKQLASLEQKNMFSATKTTLEKIPYSFHYKFKCDDERCKGHDMTILDWEVIESYRNFKKTYVSDEETLPKVHQKWFDYYWKLRESYFVVGTDSEFNRFMILGVISPRRKEAQLTLGI